jgi:cbb3-type cytochrome oxidase cytochrome c subunit
VRAVKETGDIMLRETKAKLLTAVTAVLVIALAATFSLLGNAPESNAQAPAAKPAPPADPRAAAGRQAYDRLGCANCHSIAGQGNPGSPLDGVGDRLDAKMLEAWTVGAEAAVRDGLPKSLAKRKARFAADPDIGALVAYLQTLRAAKPQAGAPAKQ